MKYNFIISAITKSYGGFYEFRLVNGISLYSGRKSITQAAEKLHVSQSALSKQLKNLEIELNNELVVRSSQGIQLTEAGILLYERGKS